MKNLLNVFLLLSLLLVPLTLPVHAQTSLGQIAGTISDGTGAVVDGVTVTVTNIGTKAVRTVTTDASGYYIVTNLPIGDYILEVAKTGFRGERRTGLSITADAHLPGDFQLQPGGTSDTVTVSAVLGESLNTTSGELAHVIDTKQVATLPLNGRNYTQLMTLIPGAVVTNPDIFAVTTSLASTNQVSNGNRADSSNLTVDGGYNQVAGSNGSLMNNVSPDFIQEVKIATSNFSAEYGRTSGPAFNIVTKSGTNGFHGGVFYYMRNNYFDAHNYFSPIKTQLIYNDFGYDVGGPIIKDKLFFFVGEEFKRLRQQQAPSRFTVPNSALLSGNFAGQAQLFYPGTKTPVPGNNISSLISADGTAIANVYRTMSKLGISYTDTPTANNLTLAPSNPLNFREDLVRLDYHLNSKHFLYGRWISDHNSLLDPFGTFSNSGVLPTTPTQRNRPGQSVLVSEIWNIRPNIINQAQANFSYAAQRIPPSGVNWERSTYGFQYNKLYPDAGTYPNGIPYVQITSFAPFQGPNFALHSPTTDIELNDRVEIVKGNHLIKVGAIVVRDRIDQNGRPYYTGNISFNASGNPNTTGNALADALIGNFNSYQEASADPTGHFRFTQPEAFVQDSWKALRNLSVEYGIRFQYIQPLYTQGNNMANFDPSVYNPSAAVTVKTNGTIVPGSGNPFNGLVRAGSGIPSDQIIRVPNVNTAIFPLIPAGAPRGLYTMNGAFGPRVGFAYSPNEKTVIRGGYGSFYYRAEGNSTFSQVNVAPFLSNTEFDHGNLSTLGNGTPNTSALQGTITGINPQLKNPYTMQYSLGVQRQLPSQMLLEVTYVGNVGHHLLRAPNINFPDLTGVAANPSFSTNYFNPYKGYGSINETLSDSNSNYNALQVYLSKRAGRVTFTAGYTYGKTLGDSQSSGEPSTLENYHNLNYNYGSTSWDRKNAFVGTFLWDIAQLRNQNVFVRESIGGWQLSGVVRSQSGPYYTIVGNTSTGTRRANYVGGSYLVTSGRNANNYINKAAFTAAPANAFGTSGVSNVQGPGLEQSDITLGKGFATERRVQGRFQADMFNVFNHTNYSTLNTTVTNSNFGTLSAAYPPRQMQFGLKLTF